MTYDLHIDTGRWRAHLASTAARYPGLVPVIKGNGYGFGREVLAAEAARLGADLIAVGTYGEVPAVLETFAGEVLVLTPWRPFYDLAGLDLERVIHTVGRVDDVAALAAAHPGARVVLEGETSMSRHGLDRHELAAAVGHLDGLSLEGFSIHLPLVGDRAAEAERWAAALAASRVETTRLFVSHLDAGQLRALQAARPGLEVRPRIGTALWLGDTDALEVRATVLDVHTVAKGEAVGYRQRPVPGDGHLLIVSGGTAHGVGLEAPSADASPTGRAKILARGGLQAAGRVRSPFRIDGRQRWFVEPPHMQVSMLFIPAGTPVPAVGQTVTAAVRFTTATFDALRWD